MLFRDSETGGVIANGRCGVRLSRLGEADVLGFPSEIEVRAGPFSGAVLDDGLPFSPRFVAQIEAFHATLRGEAEIRLTFEFEIDQTYLPTIMGGLSAGSAAGRRSMLERLLEQTEPTLGVIASATKQSISRRSLGNRPAHLSGNMDCFASLAMTAVQFERRTL